MRPMVILAFAVLAGCAAAPPRPAADVVADVDSARCGHVTRSLDTGTTAESAVSWPQSTDPPATFIYQLHCLKDTPLGL